MVRFQGKLILRTVFRSVVGGQRCSDLMTRVWVFLRLLFVIFFDSSFVNIHAFTPVCLQEHSNDSRGRQQQQSRLTLFTLPGVLNSPYAYELHLFIKKQRLPLPTLSSSRPHSVAASAAQANHPINLSCKSYCMICHWCPLTLTCQGTFCP